MNRSAIIVDAYREGSSLRDVAQLTGLSVEDVGAALRAHGIDLPEQSTGPSAAPAREALMTEDQTLAAIARIADPERPTALAVAYAVVAAASVTGEDPLAIDREGWLRLRAPAVKALRVFYPSVAWDRLGALIGLSKPAQPKVLSAEKAAWWEEIGDPAFEAACQALEAL